MHSSVGDEPDRIGLGALGIRSMFGWRTVEEINKGSIITAADLEIIRASW
jgi:hypothetical protein